MPVAGNTIRIMRAILNLSDAPLTGMTMPADITASLFRDTGSATVAASETVSMTEIGATGYYNVAFTPANSGLYTLELAEVNVNTGLRRSHHEFQVYAAGSVFAPAYSNAFCAETDVERWINAGISSSTSPSDTDATAWAESRAAVLMSVCAKLGYAVTPSTVTAGSRLEDMLREANAIGAALDYLTAQTRALAPFDAGRGRLGAFRDMWESYVGHYSESGTWIPGLLSDEISGNLISLSTDHILSGDTAAASTSQATDIGIPFTMGDVF